MNQQNDRFSTEYPLFEDVIGNSVESEKQQNLVFSPKKVYHYEPTRQTILRSLGKMPTDPTISFIGAATNLGYHAWYEKRIGSASFDVYIEEFPWFLIEIDGSAHDTPLQKNNDVSREKWATVNGKTVIRFTNKQINFELDKVFNHLKGMARLYGQVLGSILLPEDDNDFNEFETH